MKINRLFLALLAATALAAAPQVARASMFDFSYTNGGSINASGSFWTDDVDNPNAGGFGISGQAITSITGTRNGVAISGLVNVPGSPGLATVGGFYVDNALITTPLGFDWNGILFQMSDGSTFNIASANSPTGGGYIEYGGDSSANYTGVSNSISMSIGQHVPDSGTTIAMFGMAMVGMVTMKFKRKQRSDIQPASAPAGLAAC